MHDVLPIPRATDFPAPQCRRRAVQQGNLLDGDFNQQLGLYMPGGGRPAARAYLRDLSMRDFGSKPIQVADHCYGCTGGRGSSSDGALAYNLTERAA